MKKHLTRVQVYVPDNDRILVKQLEGQTVTAGGIIIPDTAKEKPQIGLIIWKGPDVHPKWEVGQKILYGKYAGTEMDFNNRTFIVLRESDISGFIYEYENQDLDDWDLDNMRLKPKEVVKKKK